MRTDPNTAKWLADRVERRAVEVADLLEGSLVQLLKDFGTCTMLIHALYSSRRLLCKQVIAVIDAMVAALQRSDFPIAR